jgi:hypothetical protein
MPVFRDLDFSVFKNQNLRGEKVKMQFRAEMFNIHRNWRSGVVLRNANGSDR